LYIEPPTDATTFLEEEEQLQSKQWLRADLAKQVTEVLAEITPEDENALPGVEERLPIAKDETVLPLERLDTQVRPDASIAIFKVVRHRRVDLASRVRALAMQAGDDGAAVESKRSRFLRPLRSASMSVAATVLLALVGPRGAARAAEPMEAPTHSVTTNSRSVESVAVPFSLEPGGMEDLLGRRAHRQYMSRDLLFGEELTARTLLQEELDELDEYTSQGHGFVGKFRGIFQIGGTGALMYGTVRVLQQAEKISITNQKKDEEEERELTGMFISIDAGEVEGAVDPKTGKNITTGGADKLPKASDPTDVAPTAGVDTEATKTEAPWLLRVLGLGNSVSSDDDSFITGELARAAVDGGGGGRASTKPIGASPTEGAAGEAESEEEEAAEEDHTEGIDTLEDLLG